MKFIKSSFVVLIWTAIIMFASVSCNKTDEWNKIQKEVDSLSLVTDSLNKITDSLNVQHPTGVVIMNCTSSLVKGDTASVVFRVNPSTFNVSLDNIILDAVSETVYDYYDGKEESETKAVVPYNKAAVNFTIASVKPVKNEAGDTLTGEWVARIATNNDEAVKYMDEAILALDIKYNDYSGKEHLLSSEVFSMTVLPTIKEGLNMWGKSCYSYDSKLIPSATTPNAYISFDANTFKKRGTDKNGVTKMYTITDNIESINATLTKDYENVFTINKNVSESANAYIEFVPNLEHKKWEELKASGDSVMIVSYVLTISDKHSHSISDTLKFTYFAKNTTEYAFTVKAEPSTQYFDLTDFLHDCGYFSEDMANIRRLSTLTSVSSINGFLLKFSMDDEHKVILQVSTFKQLTPGTVYFDADKFFTTGLVMFYPAMKTTPECNALGFKVNLKATVIE